MKKVSENSCTGYIDLKNIQIETTVQSEPSRSFCTHHCSAAEPGCGYGTRCSNTD